MNRQRSIVPLLGVVLLGLLVIVTVMMGRGNTLSLLFRYLLVGGLLSGILFPRPTLCFWFVFCGYTDLFKRLMVVFGNVQYSDLYNILGIPPVMLAGITLGILMGGIMKHFRLRRRHFDLFACGCVLMVISAVMAVKSSGGSFSAMVPAIANDGLYAMLIFVVPALYRGTDDVEWLMKLLLWAYVPVALYGVVQQVCGYQAFEIAYLKTGLSLEIKQLVDREIRAFSTLNSSTALSAVCALMCAFSLMLGLTPRRDGNGRLMRGGLSFVMAAIFLAGLIASTTRTSLMVIAYGMMGFYLFRSLAWTRVVYAVLALAFVALVLFAQVILDNMTSLQDGLDAIVGGGAFVGQMARIDTYSDRLMGFAKWTSNPDIFTLFGYGPGRAGDYHDPLYAHDLVTSILVTHGLVPLVALVIGVSLVLYRMHRRVLGTVDLHHRCLAAGLIALAFSFVAISAVSGSVLGVFPVNALMWLTIAMLMLVYQDERMMAAEAQATAPQQAMTQAPPNGAIAVRAVHRFRRSGQPASDSIR